MSESKDHFQHLRLLEAILFASRDPLSLEELTKRLPDGIEVGPLIEELATLYDNRGVNLVQRGRAWAFRTAPDLSEALKVERSVTRKLSRAAIETLATIAYHQPVTRAEIEEIRGVALSKGTLDVLLEAGWIRPKGRRRTPGRPVTWGTNEAFLDQFGLESLDSLPRMAELKAAGLIDKRPAITALSSRGKLASLEDLAEEAGSEGDGGDAGEQEGLDEGEAPLDAAAALAATFGEEPEPALEGEGEKAAAPEEPGQEERGAGSEAAAAEAKAEIEDPVVTRIIDALPRVEAK